MSTASELAWEEGEVRKHEQNLREAKQKVDRLKRQLQDERHQEQNKSAV